MEAWLPLTPYVRRDQGSRFRRQSHTTLAVHRLASRFPRQGRITGGWLKCACCHLLLSVHIMSVFGKEREARYYSMLIQGSPSNGTFEWINP